MFIEAEEISDVQSFYEQEVPEADSSPTGMSIIYKHIELIFLIDILNEGSSVRIASNVETNVEHNGLSTKTI